MAATVPVWLKDLIDKHNAVDGRGIHGLLDHWPQVSMLGSLLRDVPGTAERLDALIEQGIQDLANKIQREMMGCSEVGDVIVCLGTYEYPALSGRGSKEWRDQLHCWMQAVYDSMHLIEDSPKVLVPEPPSLNQKQRRAFSKYKLMLVYIPAWEEYEYPESFVKPFWGQYLDERQVQRIPLPGRWVAIETIAKPDYKEGVYQDDRLMVDIEVQTRFLHPHSGKGEGDDIEEDLLSKIASRLALKGGQQVQLPTVEIWNFVGNLFNWLVTHTNVTLPDLGSTNSWEWTTNSFSSEDRLLVGAHGRDGLADVDRFLRVERHDRVGFRVLVTLP